MLRMASLILIVLCCSTEGKPNPETGAWEAGDYKNRPGGGLNACMAAEVHKFVTEEGASSITELGAGSGVYSEFWSHQGLNVTCFDGNPVIKEMSHGLCSRLDLSTVQPDIPASDFTVTFEVAEHIPKERESGFIANIVHSNRQGVIISWAHLGQSGNGHVNLRDGDYVLALFKEMGYDHDQTSSNRLRNTCWKKHPKAWNAKNFFDNTFVFKKQLSAQHPEFPKDSSVEPTAKSLEPKEFSGESTKESMEESPKKSSKELSASQPLVIRIQMTSMQWFFFGGFFGGVVTCLCLFRISEDKLGRRREVGYLQVSRAEEIGRPDELDDV